MKSFVVLSQFITVLAGIAVYLAHQFDTVGYGLNPWIALPMASFLMIVPTLLIDVFFQPLEEDEEEDEPV